MKSLEDTYQQWVRDGEVNAKLTTLQSLAKQGLTNEEIAKEFDIEPHTLSDTINEYPAVAEAIKKGRRSLVALLQKKLLDKIQEGDITAIIYALKVYGSEFFHTDKDTHQKYV